MEDGRAAPGHVGLAARCGDRGWNLSPAASSPGRQGPRGDFQRNGLADAGCWSAANAREVRARGIDPFLAAAKLKQGAPQPLPRGAESRMPSGPESGYGRSSG